MKTRTKALLAVIFGNSIFGFSFLFSKVALELTIPSVMLAIRFTVAFLTLNIFVLAGKRFGLSFSLKGKPLKYVIVLALVEPVIYFMAESYGITYTSSAFAGTIIAVIPIAAILFDILFLHTKVSKRQVCCAIVSVAGVAITALGASEMKASFWGTILLLVAVCCGSSFYILSKKAGEHFTPLERTYVMFAIGSIFYILFALLQCGNNFMKILVPAVSSPAFWGCIFYLAVISSVAAFLFLNYGSSHISASEASIFANLTTVISIFAGVCLLGESFTFPQLAGALMILGSVTMANIPVKSKAD